MSQNVAVDVAMEIGLTTVSSRSQMLETVAGITRGQYFSVLPLTWRSASVVRCACGFGQHCVISGA
jgi:hypothetical protein